MKRYLLFCHKWFYPNGGWEDFIGDYDTVEEAKRNAHNDFSHIVDTSTKKIAYYAGNTGVWYEGDPTDEC